MKGEQFIRDRGFFPGLGGSVESGPAWEGAPADGRRREGRAALGGGEGTAEGAPFTDDELAALIRLARKGVDELVALQKAALAA